METKGLLSEKPVALAVIAERHLRPIRDLSLFPKMPVSPSGFRHDICPTAAIENDHDLTDFRKD
jgi:hypothetical protein